jgi:hypothetical protein
MKISDITLLRDNIYELERNGGNRKPGKDDFVKLKFSGIQTDLTPQRLSEKLTFCEILLRIIISSNGDSSPNLLYSLKKIS